MVTLSPLADNPGPAAIGAILLLDEHTAALDLRNAEPVLELTRRFVAGYQLTVLTVTHDMKRALSEASRVVMMHEGRILADVEGERKNPLVWTSWYACSGNHMARSTLKTGTCPAECWLAWSGEKQGDENRNNRGYQRIYPVTATEYD
jgi:energy-coupling factor transporter ATP-binding protein EcfA2